ncbi:hypothetical protein F4779DRAFT_617091 [Xylariaceae sp. FL0662B]|nr:hypothetical protein F4779DRAFT_617091 [Xylariaceae sp. FL0662B]
MFLEPPKVAETSLAPLPSHVPSTKRPASTMEPEAKRRKFSLPASKKTPKDKRTVAVARRPPRIPTHLSPYLLSLIQDVGTFQVMAAKPALQAAQKRLPRFLFRGFHSKSGGGIDPRLNGPDGIIPHGFLGGKAPTSMYEIPKLRAMLRGHLTGQRIETHFSSWAADLATALRYSGGFSPRRRDGAWVAVLDTAAREPHVDIHHVKALHAAGLADAHYDHEYLAYGPVRGPAYRCVSCVDIEALGFDAAYRKVRSGRLTRADARMALGIGGLFRRPGDGRAGARVAVAVAAAFLTLRARHWGAWASRAGVMDKWDAELKLFVRELVARVYPELRYAPLTVPTAPTDTAADDRMVNPETFVCSRRYPKLQQMMQLLLAVEKEITIVSAPPRLEGATILEQARALYEARMQTLASLSPLI